MRTKKKSVLRRNRLVKSDSRYYNLGWFGQHPGIYELGSMLISPIRRSAARVISHSTSLKILDVACGTGSNSYLLAKHGHEVVGVDLDGEMLTWARKKGQKNLNITFVQGDATKLEFNDSTFDAVTISFAMHDVPYEIGLKILAEAKRVLIPTGKIIIVDYNEPANNVIAKFLCFFAMIYESPNFKKFIKVGLEKYLKENGLFMVNRFTILGAVQVVSCS